MSTVIGNKSFGVNDGVIGLEDEWRVPPPPVVPDLVEFSRKSMCLAARLSRNRSCQGRAGRTLDEADVDTLRVEREESAVAAASGAWVTGDRAAVICQSSGLANTINAIGSLSIAAQLPFLALVTRRGDLGEFNVAQVPAGYSLPAMMDEMGVRHTTVSESGSLRKTVRMAAETAFSTRTPYLVLAHLPSSVEFVCLFIIHQLF